MRNMPKKACSVSSMEVFEGKALLLAIIVKYGVYLANQRTFFVDSDIEKYI